MKINRKTIQLILLIIGIVLVSCKDSGDSFKYVEPESKRFSSEKLKKLRTHLKNSGSSALMILVDGNVVFEWGKTKKKHTIHSIRKALLNSLYGIAINQGLIDSLWTLKELNITDIEPGLSVKESKARVIDLLKSRSGVYHHAAGVSKGMLLNMPERECYQPDEHFYYNNWDFNVLGAILEQKTGKSIYELFASELAKPLGMLDYKGTYKTIDGESVDARIPNTDGFYQFELSKSQYPAYHFRMSARDLALYGQLYLNKGHWKGIQLVPEEWIELSTRPHSIYNSEQNIAYGMLWYVLMPSNERVSKSFYHTGLGIHLLAVYPDAKMVIVHRVDTEDDFAYSKRDLIKMLELVWDAKID